MGVIEHIADRHMVRQKIARLIDLAVEENGDMLVEALSLIHSLFGEADVTIYNFKKAELVVSTIYNEDILDAVRTELSSIVEYEDIQGYVVYDKKQMRRLRPGVTHLGIVPLFTKKERELVLAIEYYSKYDGIALDKLADLFKVMTLVVRNAYLSGLGQNALRVDGSTMLPNRDALIERLEGVVKMGIKRCCLGIVTLSNATKLTEKIGGAETDRLLRAIGVELGKLMPGSVYRVGGTKFGIVISGDIFYARPILEGMIDRVLLLDEAIITANVLCPLEDDAYTTLAVCEKYLKHTDEDVVTIVRGSINEEFEAEYRDVQDVFFDAAYKEVHSDSGSVMYEKEDMAEAAVVSEESEVENVEPQEFVMNDVFGFERWNNNE